MPDDRSAIRQGAVHDSRPPAIDTPSRNPRSTHGCIRYRLSDQNRSFQSPPDGSSIRAPHVRDDGLAVEHDIPVDGFSCHHATARGNVAGLRNRCRDRASHHLPVAGNPARRKGIVVQKHSNSPWATEAPTLRAADELKNRTGITFTPGKAGARPTSCPCHTRTISWSPCCCASIAITCRSRSSRPEYSMVLTIKEMEGIGYSLIVLAMRRALEACGRSVERFRSTKHRGQSLTA